MKFKLYKFNAIFVVTLCILSFAKGVLAEDPSHLDLNCYPPNFICSFDVKEKDVRSTSTKQKDRDFLRWEFAQNVKSGRMTQADADVAQRFAEQEASITSSEEKYNITLSSNNGKLLYHSQSSRGNVIVLFDGLKTYTLILDNDNKVQSVLVQPGFMFYQMRNFPLPAINLPSVPLIKTAKGNVKLGFSSSNVSCMAIAVNTRSNSGENTATYEPAVVSAKMVDGKFQIDNISYGKPNESVDQWEFSEYKKLSGVLVANNLTHTLFATNQTSQTSNLLVSPSNVCNYQLVFLNSTPLDAQRFNILNYLTNLTPVQIETAKYTVMFEFKINNGSLEEQGERERRRELATFINASSGNVKGQSRGGVYLLLSLLFAGAARMLWIRRTT